MKNLDNFETMAADDLNTVTGGQAIFNGANGYLTRDKNGHYKYVVTKGAADAVFGVISNGWGGAGAGFGRQH